MAYFIETFISACIRLLPNKKNKIITKNTHIFEKNLKFYFWPIKIDSALRARVCESNVYRFLYHSN